MNLINQSCCFIGHRKIENKSTMYEQVKQCVKDLITKSNITTFLFGSRSEFNDLCVEVVTELKDFYPDITLVYVRAEYEHISADLEKQLLAIYDNTYYAEKAHNAKRLVYIKRNEELIDKSSICVFYYKYNAPHSGTAMAFQYAQQNKKRIIEII